MAYPMITNKDIEQSIWMYVYAISKLIEIKIAEGRVKELRGDTAVEGFCDAVEVRSLLQ